MIDGVGYGWLGKASAKIGYEHTIHISLTAKGKIRMNIEKKTVSSEEL